MLRHEPRFLRDGDSGAGGRSENDPNKDMLSGEPTPSGNPTSATSNPGVSGVGGQGMQDAGGKDEGVRGFEAAKAGVGPFGNQTLSDRMNARVGNAAVALFTAPLPGISLLGALTSAARRNGYNVQDVTTDPDGGLGSGDPMRDRSKTLTNEASASDRAVRSSVDAANREANASSGLSASSSLLNMNGYAAANRRRRTLFDTNEVGLAALGG